MKQVQKRWNFPFPTFCHTKIISSVKISFLSFSLGDSTFHNLNDGYNFLENMEDKRGKTVLTKIEHTGIS